MPEVKATYVRVRLNNITEPDDSPLMFDVKVSSDRHILGNWPIFGMCGEISDPMPLVLNKQGEIDFGSAMESRDRFWQTNLRDSRIAKGERVLFTKAPNDDRIRGEERAYRISSVVNLGEKELE